MYDKEVIHQYEDGMVLDSKIFGNYSSAKKKLDELAKRYNLQIKIMPREENKLSKDSKLEGLSSIFLLIISILFLSSNFTGNVIGNTTNSTSSLIGVVLFITGLIVAFAYFRRK